MQPEVELVLYLMNGLKASNVCIEIQEEKIPISESVRGVVNARI